jgi:diguanylate cyclase (GGDEF)-like protein/PAS domain S-box-containing protein
MKFRPERLLIVDDNEMNRDMLARRLAKKGYEVSTAENACDIENQVQRESIDLVLLDIEMPQVSGLEALVRIRKLYTSTQLPVIMVTARNQSDDIVNALELGANDYVTKPIDFPVALARINNQLSHKRAEHALRESEERYALAARGANDGLWDWNLAENTIYFSPRWKAMLGYPETAMSDSPEEWFSRIHEADKEQVKRRLAAHLNGATPHFESEARMRHQDGVFRWMLSRGIMVRDANGKPLRMAGSQTDITEGKVADPLTGLPNRLLFMDRLSQLIEHRKRHEGFLFAVLFLDLDGFKMINDSFGHVFGDKLLIAVAHRLVNSLRHRDAMSRIDDRFTIARLGGDEFAIILGELREPGDAPSVANRLMSVLRLPFIVDEKEVFTSASIGIALSTSGYQHAEEFLRDADTAMYRAKSLGKARCEVFDANMRASVTHRLQLETDLRHAIDRQEFRNYYQPIISLDSGKIAGFEALLRWQHPTQGLIEPNEFIPIAEETGMIRELGWWSLSDACRRIAEWRKSSPELTVSVNLSAKQFLQTNLAAQLETLLQELSVPPAALKLELTESSIMVDPVAAATLLSQMKSLGISIAIDDFGTGYSSLSYLQRFPLDTLKIDRSFIKAMGACGKEEKNIIIRSIIPLAENLGLDVVAEGVENTDQMSFLKELQCKYAQGFLFSQAVDADAATKLLRNPAYVVDRVPDDLDLVTRLG